MLLADIVLSMSNMVANTHQQREEKYTPVIGYLSSNFGIESDDI